MDGAATQNTEVRRSPITSKGQCIKWSANGQAELLQYRIDGRLVASSLVFLGPDLAGGYLFGAHPDLRDQADVMTLLVSSTLELAHQRGCSKLDMLRGAEPHKHRWRPVEVSNRRVILGRPGSMLARTYACLARTDRCARQTVNKRLPWVRHLREQAYSTVSSWRVP